MSAKIKWIDATAMLESYQNSTDALKNDPPNGCEIIRGFKFDKADIQSIIDDPLTEEVIIMPAVVKEDLSKPNGKQRFTVIVAGLTSSGDIITTKAYDFSLPTLNSTPSNYPYKPTC
jgi:hypothetical protein